MPSPFPAQSTTRDIVVIGGSAGSLPVLRQLVSELPADFPAAVFVVVHVWSESPSQLPGILSRSGPLPARVPRPDEPIARGTIYVAPSDNHLIIEDGVARLVHGPRECRSRPAINPLFRSAAVAGGPRTISVILSGSLDDGTAGTWAVKECGGVAIVQDPADASFPNMPRSALQNVSIDYKVSAAELAPLLIRLVHEPLISNHFVVPPSVALSNEAVKSGIKQMDLTPFGKSTHLACPECNGALFEIPIGRSAEYRCHVGHAYSPETLDAAQRIVIEQALWEALRSAKENAALDERLAHNAETQGLANASAIYQRNAADKHQRARALQDFLYRFSVTLHSPLQAESEGEKTG